MQAAITPAFQPPAGGYTAKEFLRGVAAWAAESFADYLGHSLGFGQVMVLLAIAVSPGDADARSSST